MEPSGWMEVDTKRGIPLPFPLERFRLDLLAGTNQWTNNVLQLLDAVIRVSLKASRPPLFPQEAGRNSKFLRLLDRVGEVIHY